MIFSQSPSIRIERPHLFGPDTNERYNQAIKLVKHAVETALKNWRPGQQLYLPLHVRSFVNFVDGEDGPEVQIIVPLDRDKIDAFLVKCRKVNGFESASPLADRLSLGVSERIDNAIMRMVQLGKTIDEILILLEQRFGRPFKQEEVASVIHLFQSPKSKRGKKEQEGPKTPVSENSKSRRPDGFKLSARESKEVDKAKAPVNSKADTNTRKPTMGDVKSKVVEFINAGEGVRTTSDVLAFLKDKFDMDRTSNSVRTQLSVWRSGGTHIERLKKEN